MVFIFDSLLTNILVSFLTIIIAIVIYYKWSFQYWKNRNVFCPATAIPFGTAKNPLTSKLYYGYHFKQLYDALKPQGYQYAGLYSFTKPLFLPIDLKIIKSILQQDFQHFTERGFYYNERDDPLSANLFALGGERWRILRTKTSAAFTPGKIKMMFDILLQCGNQMHEALKRNCEEGQPIDVKDVAACYTIDIIGSIGFGIECNSFKYPNAEFRKYARTIFESITPIRMIFLGFAFTFPNAGRWLGLKLFEKETSDFFMKVVKDAVQFRETNKVVRNDMLQILIDLKNELKSSEEEDKGFTMNELAAQVFIFFAAGFETSSTTMTFCLYELAINPEIQERVRDEVDLALKKHDGKFTNESIADMKYLGQVVDETLRKYPPVAFITRECVKDYKIPDTEVIIEKGIVSVFSILGLHHDPDYYPNPEKFDPDRFSMENKQKRIPFTYMPFGEGPRICIGLRLGLLQTKVGLALLLKHFKFSLNKKTVIPIQMIPLSFTLLPKTGIFLDIEKVNDES